MMVSDAALALACSGPDPPSGGDLGPPCLCHEDLHGANLLFQRRGGRWRLAGVLDFDKAWSGFHECDLARMAFWTGMTGPGFWAAYQQGRPLDPGFEDRKAVFQLLWCLEVAWKTPKHRTDTENLCRFLGLTGPDGDGKIEAAPLQ